MTNLPFGFGPGGEPPDPNDPSAQFALFAELQKVLTMMQSSGGAVNWELAKQLATQALAGASNIVSPADRAGTADALRLADHWLDDVTDLPSGVQSAEAWTRVEWLNRTLPVWTSLCEPVAARVVA